MIGPSHVYSAYHPMFATSPAAKEAWRVVFYHREGSRLVQDRKAPWHPDHATAMRWAYYFQELGYFVAVQSSTGTTERLTQGLPGLR